MQSALIDIQHTVPDNFYKSVLSVFHHSVKVHSLYKLIYILTSYGCILTTVLTTTNTANTFSDF